MAKHKKPLEPCQGRYSAISHDLLDSVSFMDAGHTARSLLFDLIRQHTGQNNGHLQMAASWMKKTRMDVKRDAPSQTWADWVKAHYTDSAGRFKCRPEFICSNLATNIKL